MRQSAVIIYKPRSGRRRGRDYAVSQMVQALERRGLRVGACATAAPGDATRLSREAAAAGVQTIIVYGGDGTVNEVLQLTICRALGGLVRPAPVSRISAPA